MYFFLQNTLEFTVLAHLYGSTISRQVVLDWSLGRNYNAQQFIFHKMKLRLYNYRISRSPSPPSHKTSQNSKLLGTFAKQLEVLQYLVLTLLFKNITLYCSHYWSYLSLKLGQD